MDFIRYYLPDQKRYYSWVFFLLVVSKKSPIFYLLILLTKLTSVDCHKKLALWLLKGESKQQLEQVAREYYGVYLSERKNSEVMSLLEEIKMTGAEVHLLSATIDPVAKAIAEALNLTYFSSQLAFDAEGICEGKLQWDASGKKDKFVSEALLTSGDFTITTDNYTDLTLVKRARKANVIVYSELEKRKWPDQASITFIRIN
jgi:phosphoserine phosphatase